MQGRGRLPHACKAGSARDRQLANTQVKCDTFSAEGAPVVKFLRIQVSLHWEVSVASVVISRLLSNSVSIRNMLIYRKGSGCVSIIPRLSYFG